MAKPVRLQLSRKRGFNLQALSMATNGLQAVNVARPSKWGNDFTVADVGTPERAVDLFDHDLDKFETFHPDEYEVWIAPLRGKNLGCWCSSEPCHATVLLRRASPVCEEVR